MANANAPKGLQPSRYLNGSPWNGQTNRYYIPHTDNTAYYVGDPVTSAHSSDANGVPTVTIGVAGSPIRGVIVAIEPNPLNLDYESIPASKGTTDYYVQVADDPNIIFQIQDSGGAALTSAVVNLNGNFAIAAPSQAWQQSATVLNTTGIAVTSTLNLRILQLSQIPGNVYGKYALWDVLINNHELRGGTAGTP